MALEIKEKHSGGVTVLELSGQVVRGAEADQLRKKLKDVLDKGKTGVVLDLANLSHIDSAGLGTLVGVYTSAQSQGAKVKLARSNERVNSLLHITKLITVFESYSSVEEALKSFA